MTTTFDQDVRDQPAVLRRVLDGWPAMLPVVRDLLGPGGGGPRVILTGMGASLAAVSIAEPTLRSSGRAVAVIDAGELLLHGADAVPPDSLVVAASQTGLSRETVALVRRLRDRDVRVIGLLNDDASPMAASLPGHLSIDAGPESSNASKTFTATQLITLLLTSAIAPSPSDAACLAGVPAVVAELVERPGLVDGALAALSGVPYLAFLAHGPAMSAARYGALLAGEILALPAAAVTISEFRHGPVELLAGGIGAVVLAPPDGPGRGVAVELATSIGSRGGRVWLIASGEPVVGVEPVTAVTNLGALDGVASAVAASVVIQRFLVRYAPLVGRAPGMFSVFDPVLDTGRGTHAG